MIFTFGLLQRHFLCMFAPGVIGSGGHGARTARPRDLAAGRTHARTSCPRSGNEMDRHFQSHPFAPAELRDRCCD